MFKNKIKVLLAVFLLSPLAHAEETSFFLDQPVDQSYENGTRLDYQACRVLVKRGEILPMSDLMELANKRSSDHILDAYLVKENDQYYYQIESVGNNGVVSVFYMDATNGEIAQNFKVTQ
jgi:uncharacterized membrane protein YkoI